MVLRFLTDENIPKLVVSWLREQGYDVTKAQEVALNGATDSEIPNWSLKNGRMIIALDDDFSRLHRQLDKPLGVILIRTHPPTPDRINQLLSVMFSKVQTDKHANELVVLSDRSIRIGIH